MTWAISSSDGLWINIAEPMKGRNFIDIKKGKKDQDKINKKKTKGRI